MPVLGGTWEALERVLRKASYFKTGLRKMECARQVAQHMDPARNASRSFQAFASRRGGQCRRLGLMAAPTPTRGPCPMTP